MKCHGRLLAVCVAVLVICISGSAWATVRPRIAVDATRPEVTVTIYERPAVRFRVGNGKLTPRDRANLTAQRLNELIAAGLTPQAITVKATRSQAQVVAGTTMICVATAADAKPLGISPLSLANTWVANIRSLLSMPAITLSGTSIVIPLGEKRSVTVSGAAAGPITVNAPPELPAVANDKARFVEVTGSKLGTGTVEIIVEGEKALLNVEVKKWAGQIGIPTTAQVTGNPCPTATMGYAAKRTLREAFTTEPGASVSFGSVNFCGDSLERGKLRAIAVDYVISGDGYIPRTGKAWINVQNTSMPREEVQQLFYSNDPEVLQKYQTLFAGKLETDKASRLLFHHQNAMGKQAHFVVELINPGQTPASVRVFRGVSNPLVDTFMVGYIASSEFLKGYTNEVSVIETIPPMSKLIMVSQMLENLETASGVIEMRQISGGDTFVRVASLPPGIENPTQGVTVSAPKEFKLPLSEQVYPSPVKNIAADYVVGKRWTFIPIGKHAVTDASSQKKLEGNYGVTYKISVKVSNPTDTEKKVTVAFDPSAGTASGVFMIDGAFVAAKPAEGPEDIPLASYDLKPGETREVRIVTVPVAGSNYPATLVVRS